MLPARQIPIGLGAPTLGGSILGVVSSSTGSVLVDGLLGAGLGYAIAPRPREKTSYALYGALATAFAGVLGAGVLVGVRYLRK